MGTQKAGMFIYNQGPLLLIWFNLIPEGIGNHMPNDMCDEITCPLPVVNDCTTQDLE